ncbi:hypothetical protein BGZ61DRAFT_375472 [Ilyonectria robusta]|uniref:uncharacterized protein n=1 Tax=Ilyonectria robusta TaxID=1079257 RepID=UPI001E8E0977|nr:uncharacterized protein BGZ61DRAFT_375472 [Ilyonectria robusta]KAH8650778.1 hypothetical protein BGZ61DRAFT_375472 [Ilyonectria robusta]
MRLLLAVEGVDTDAKIDTGSGETPLMRAAKSGHDEVVDLLLIIYRVNLQLRDNIGNILLFQAVLAGYKRVVDILLYLEAINIEVIDNNI